MGICIELNKDLRSNLVFPSFLFRAVGQEVRAYNVYNKTTQNFSSEILPEYDVGERYLFTSADTLFISGGQNRRNEIMDVCFEINIATNEFIKLASMLEPKGAHGIIKFGLDIYVFGGW